MAFTDADGREYLVCGPDGKNCTTVSDADFYAERKELKKTGNTYTGSGDFFENGQVKNADGGVVATYVQISIDDLDKQYIFAIRGAVNPIPGAVLEFFQLSVELGTTVGVARYVRLGRTAIELGLGGPRNPPIAAQRLRRLGGLNRADAREALTREGFNTRGPNPAGNETWTHPDGSRVTIKSNGEVVRNPNAAAVRSRGLGEGRKGWEIDPETGNVVRPHSVPREKVN